MMFFSSSAQSRPISLSLSSAARWPMASALIPSSSMLTNPPSTSSVHVSNSSPHLSYAASSSPPGPQIPT